MRNEYLTINKLSEIDNLIHAFTTRTCRSVGDILKNQFGLNSDKVFTVKQVHGDGVYIIRDGEVLNPQSTIQNPKSIEADAIITNIKNLPIGVFTADCIPIILADIKGRGVGIIHAGRVGTSLEITKKTIGKIMEVFDISPKDIIVGIGPGIGGCCYEVDEKSINPFKDRLEYFKKIAIEKDNGRWMLNLIGVNKIQLMESGLKSENIFTAEFCTSCHNDKFFSYRREGKTAGRMVSFVAIKE
ncbi:MAG: peptidoglycan editing factor PgeF [Nitrospinae bacterium]|nr:peptidoglycan editing factor PgeF [Nitrospinota bacterium]